MADPMRERYPEELENTAVQVSLRLTELAIGKDDAARIGWELAEHLRLSWGGRQIYIMAASAETASQQMGLLDIPNHAGAMNDREMLVDVAEQIEERLVGMGLAHDDASRIAWDVTRHLNTYWGGGHLYICKGLHYEISRRDAEIYRRFNGENHDWLATEYDLTVQHIYRIVKRVGQAERNKRQPVLFTDSSNSG